jgi:hypothetical protein
MLDESDVTDSSRETCMHDGIAVGVLSATLLQHVMRLIVDLFLSHLKYRSSL